jgi:hypothetical protein
VSEGIREERLGMTEAQDGRALTLDDIGDTGEIPIGAYHVYWDNCVRHWHVRGTT